MDQWASEVGYWEIHGSLDTAVRRPPCRDIVVLSNITRGEQTSPGADGVTVRYVARGREDYRIGGKSCRLEAGQVMVAPHSGGADCEVRHGERLGTLGVCTLVRGSPDDWAWLPGPLVFGTRDSPVNALMKRGAVALHSAQGPKLQVAEDLIDRLKGELPSIARNLLDQAAAVSGAKPATRFESLRRAYLAKAYLDAITDRQINLDEVAAVVGVSSFRLLAAYQQCFRQTPADYHRKLRLRLALDEAKRRRVPIATIADDFGFADASSFSHAYRRAFGQAPIWSKQAAA